METFNQLVDPPRAMRLPKLRTLEVNLSTRCVHQRVGDHRWRGPKSWGYPQWPNGSGYALFHGNPGIFVISTWVNKLGGTPN